MCMCHVGPSPTNSDALVRALVLVSIAHATTSRQVEGPWVGGDQIVHGVHCQGFQFHE